MNNSVKKFWTYSISVSLSLVILFFIINYTADELNRFYAASIVFSLILIQFVLNLTHGVVRRKEYTQSMIVVGVVFMLFLALLLLFLWNYMALGNC